MPFIPLIHWDGTPIAARPKLLGERSYGAKIQDLDMTPCTHEPIDVLKKYRSKLTASTRQLIRDRQAVAPNRSNRIFAIVAGLHQASASLDEIASVVWASPYFQDKHGQCRTALETEITRIIAKLGE